MAKRRWRVERDDQDPEQEVGLDTTKGAAGEASIITPRSASRPRAS